MGSAAGDVATRAIGGWRAPMAAALALAAAAPAAAHEDHALRDLGGLSIEELANVQITSVSKRPELLSHAAASVFVISADDIRRSGASSLPETLRLAPNLQVGRVDARDYSISARGLNAFEVTNKLLVLIDGRSVYTPLYGGVDWDAQTVILPDIERIEVISGPGGTLWGANAVNGVVNIISKSAFDTQGGLIDVTAGDRDQTLDLRYGGAVGDNGAFRVYASALGRGPTDLASGAAAKDRWRGLQGGFRTDWNLPAGAFTLQGDIYDDDLGRLLTKGEYIRGGNLLGRWDRTLANGSTLGVQAYYDLTRRRARGVFDQLATYDVEARQGLTLGGRHSVVWGGGYRITDDDFVNLINAFVLDPPRRRVSLGNIFAQDDVRLRHDLTLTVGLKVESSNFSGVDYLPNVRLAWRPADRHLLWAAASRAVRTPSRIERELVFPGLLVKGGFGAEKLIAYEAGYRGQPSARTSVSVSVFYNVYDDIRTTQPDPRTFLPIILANGAEGRTYGIEAWGDYDVRDGWRLSLGVATLQKTFRLKPGRADLTGLKTGGNDPHVQVTARSQMRLSDRLNLDVRLRGVDALPKPRVPGYVEADMRLGWRVSDAVEASLSGFNLLAPRRLETAEPRSTRVPRSVQLGLRWRY